MMTSSIEEQKLIAAINFREELISLINRYSMENGSNTPDIVLADYLIACLEAFDEAVTERTYRETAKGDSL
jgi:hypothetical protein